MSENPSGEVSSHDGVPEREKIPQTNVTPIVQTVIPEKEQIAAAPVAKSPKAPSAAVLAILRRASQEVHHDESENTSSNPIIVLDKVEVPVIAAKSSGTVPPTKVQIVITEEMAADQDADSMLKAMGMTPKAVPAKGILKSNLTTASSDEEPNVHAKPSHSPDRGNLPIQILLSQSNPTPVKS